ncbi:MAG TPA: glycerophosphodiester phosphodiesterase [Kofleriaceae bacterium]
MRNAALAIAVGACTAPLPPPSITQPVEAPMRLDYEGHRGCRGLRPENTIGAFDRAIELGVDTLEMDVMLTADDVLVVHHDEHLNPDITRDGSAWLPSTGPALRSLAFDALEHYDVGRIAPGTAYAARFADQLGGDGVRIPKLRDVIVDAERKSAGRIRYNIEIKTTPGKPDDTAPPDRVADAIVAIARELGVIDRVTIQSFDWRGLRRVAAIAPEVPRSCLTEAHIPDSTWTDGLALGSDVPQLVAQFGCQIWSPDYETLTRPQVAEAHALHLRVLPWTVDDHDAIVRMIALGVDGVITDFPDRLPSR